MNLKKYTPKDIHGLFKEAIRTLPGYDHYDPQKEPKSLINFEKTKEDYNILLHPCLNYTVKHPECIRDGQCIVEAIQNVTGKSFRKDGKIGSVILTLDTDYRTDLLDKDGKVLPGKEEEWNKAVARYFEAGTDALINVLGITKEDVLYASVHLDETSPHLHMAFMPINQDRKGCSMKKYDKEFLLSFHQKTEAKMHELGIDATLLNGAGQHFDPQKMTHQQREESVALAKEIRSLKHEMEEAKQELSDKDAEMFEANRKLASFNTQISEKEDIIERLSATVNTLTVKNKKLEEENEKLTEECNHLLSFFENFFLTILGKLREFLKEVAFLKASRYPKIEIINNLDEKAENVIETAQKAIKDDIPTIEKINVIEEAAKDFEDAYDELDTWEK